MKTYLRPFGLVYGADAREMILKRRAGALGGMPAIAFTHVEVIARDAGKVSCKIEAFDDQPKYLELTQRRGAFARLDLTTTQVMGIVNATPDSFSDGGRSFESADAVANAQRLLDEGADVLDIGGESTRPGSDEVDADEEWRRIAPVLQAFASKATISIDTRKSDVMRKGFEKGAAIINDVSALQHDPDSATVAAKLNAPVILMHALGQPKTMQLNPRYEHVVLDVYDGLELLISKAVAAGIPKSRIMVDPGIGFGKTYSHNLTLMREMSIFHGLGVPVMIGLSRKAYIGALTGEKKASDRVAGSVGGALHAATQGAHVLRVHDVKATVDALAVFTASCDPSSVMI